MSDPCCPSSPALQTRYCRVSVPTISTVPQSSLVAVWRKRAVLPENVSIVGAGVMVPQVSSPIGMGAAWTTESGGNVTAAGVVHGAGDRFEGAGLVEDRDRARDRELCPGLHHGELHGAAQTHHHHAIVGRGGDRQRSTIGARDIWNLRLRRRSGGATVPAARRGGHDEDRAGGPAQDVRSSPCHHH